MTTVFPSLNGSLLYVPAWVLPLRLSLDLLSSVHATSFLMIFLGIISRRVKLSQRLLRFMTGWFTGWGHYSVPWVIGLRYIKSHLQLAKNEVILKSKTLWLWSLTKTSSTGQPSPPSSYPNSRFHDDTCSIRELTFASYGSTYEHKTLRRCSWPIWGSKDRL